MRKRILAGMLMLIFCLGMIPVSAYEETEMTEESAEKPFNILLIGVDRRDDSWNGNADVMMLVTVNFDKQTIFLTSFLRDLYADIPGVGVRKLNAACANGGAELCVETIEANYKVDIDNYAMVDFSSMREIVDALGGVDMEISEEERLVSNDYIKVMCEADGVPAEEHLIEAAGLVHMDGYQAVGYARNRYTGGTNDFGRTGRQREIMMGLFEKEESAGMDEMIQSFLEILPFMESDINPLSILALLPKFADIQEFDVEELHIPYDNEYYVQDEILIPTDMDNTISKLKETIG
ncbi:MAG: LCP family protein [Eubacteriales bacterium]|nr:LCP family protein [Eubacteriales bacterium]